MQLSLFLLSLMGHCCFIKCRLYEYHYVNDSMNWSDARQYCWKKYTDLATVSNMTDVKRLQSKFPIRNAQEEAWIGLYKPKNGRRMWHWSLPGVEFNIDTAKWFGSEGSETGNENCGFINKNFKWGDDPCQDENKKTHFLCYNESNATHKFHLNVESKTWWEAQSYCRENHTDLVSGLQQLEDEELKRLVNKSSKWLYIGLFRDTWRWSDGSNFSFRNWDRDYTDETENQQDYGVTLKDSGRWKYCCADEKKPFFCYEDKVILIQERMNWEDALYYCRKHYHDLVTITNLDEQRWVQEKAKNATTGYVWTGLRYTCTLGFWFWVSSEVVCYKNWASGQDGNDCDMSGAMARGGEHKWFKRNDTEEFNFICSKF